MTRWQERAACRGKTHVFFSGAMDMGRGGAAPRIAAAKAICATCPVQEECLADGSDDLHGIRAGKTPDERRAEPMRRRNDDVRCGTPQGYKRHYRAGEPACQPCKDAHALAWRENLARNPDMRQRRLAKRRSDYLRDPDSDRARSRDWYRRNVAQRDIRSDNERMVG